MELSYIFGAIGILIGFAFFLNSFYQRAQRKKMRVFNRSQAWYMYKKATRLLNTIHIAGELYHKNDNSNLNSEIVKKLAESEAFGLEILDETIRHIQLFDPDFNNKIFQQWKDGSKLNDNKELFELKEVKEFLKKSSEESVELSRSGVSVSLPEPAFQKNENKELDWDIDSAYLFLIEMSWALWYRKRREAPGLKKINMVRFLWLYGFFNFELMQSVFELRTYFILD